MSSADEVDIGRLSESEREALQTYTTVTGQEPAAAIPLLRRSQWNVQVCFQLCSCWEEAWCLLMSAWSDRSLFPSSLTAKAPTLSRRLVPRSMPRHGRLAGHRT